MEAINLADFVTEDNLALIEQSKRHFPAIVCETANQLAGNAPPEELLVVMSSVRDHINSVLMQRQQAREARDNQVFNMTAYCKQPNAVRSGRLH